MSSVAWRFDTYVFKNKTVSDTAQVPAAATITFYRQGATVSQAAFIPVTVNDPDPQPTTIAVYDSGTLVVGDILRVQGDPAAQLSVGEVISPTSIKVLNLTLNPINLAVADRLIDTSSPQPIAYKDPLGTVAIGSSISTDPTTGRAGCYLLENVLDYVVTGTDITPRAFADLEGGGSIGWLNARRFSSIQAAIDALPSDGGVVYLPAGTYEITTTLVIPRTKPVHLLGDGAERTIISSAGPNLDILHLRSSYSTIENLTIKGPGVGGTGRGIVVGQLFEGGIDPEIVRSVSLIGCRVIDTGSWCLYFLDFADPNGVSEKTLTLWAHVERCHFRNNRTSGVIRVGRDCNAHLYQNSGIDFFRGAAVSAISSTGLTWINCTFEDRRDVPAELPPGIDENPYVELDNCRNVRLLGCWFESHAQTENDNLDDVKWRFISIGPSLACEDVSVDGCRFVRQKGRFPKLMRVDKASKAISLVNPTCTLSETLDNDRFISTDPALMSSLRRHSSVAWTAKSMSPAVLFEHPQALSILRLCFYPAWPGCRWPLRARALRRRVFLRQTVMIR